MNKEKIKTFVKDHKKEIIIGAGLTVVGVAAGVIGFKWLKSLPKDDGEWLCVIMCPSEKDVAAWHKVVEDFRDYKNGAEMYIPITGSEWLENAGTNIVENSEGVFTVTGGFVFVKPIVEEA